MLIVQRTACDSLTLKQLPYYLLNNMKINITNYELNSLMQTFMIHHNVLISLVKF